MDRLMKKLEMATRVQEFQRAHPYADKNQAAIAAQFEAKLAQAHRHSDAAQEQLAAANAAKQQRQQIRRHLEAQTLRGVARIGAFARRDDTKTASRFVVPRSKTSNAAFLVHATSLLEVARENHDALVRSGLPRGQLGEIAAALGEFRTATAQVQTSEQQQRESRVACEAALAEVLELLDVLDALNLGRYQSDAATLRMWRDVRMVERPPTTRSPRGGAETAAPNPPAARDDGERDAGENQAA